MLLPAQVPAGQRHDLAGLQCGRNANCMHRLCSWALGKPAASTSPSFPTPAAQIAIDSALLYAHVWECLGVAWAVHETVGNYMTAALVWLESRGTADPALLAQQYRVTRLSALTAAPQSGLAIQSAEEEEEEEQEGEEGHATQQQQQQQQDDPEEHEGHGTASYEEPRQRAALLKRSTSKKKRSKRQQ